MNKIESACKSVDNAEISRRNFLKAGATIAGASLLRDAFMTATVLASEESSEEVQFLFVQNASEVAIGKGRMSLTGVNPTTIFFSDRPKRIAGHMTTEDFVLDWQEGTSKESFHSKPPNATLSIFDQDEIVNIVVELKNPRFEGSNLVYDINILEEGEKIPSGPASLFIDPIGMPLSPTSAAGVHRRRRRRRIRHEVIR